jgi:biotin synthase
MFKKLADKVISSAMLTKAEALLIAQTDDANLNSLFDEADRIRKAFRGDIIDLCAIVNAKSGACSEDCSYCAQSAFNKSDISIFPFIGEETIIRKAEEAKAGGVRRFAVVTSGKRPSKEEIKHIARAIGKIREMGLGACASLGLLDKAELAYLRDHGLERCHNNLETSENYFPSICTTHKFPEKLKTLEAANDVGLDVCSGGIFGMGESWQDRIDLAFTLRELDAISTPVNFLNPIRGTKLDHLPFLPPYVALKIVSLMRFVMPQKEIRICGGRFQTLGDLQSSIFRAGADSMMTGDYLVTTGVTYADDLKMIKELGLKNNG